MKDKFGAAPGTYPDPHPASRGDLCWAAGRVLGLGGDFRRKPMPQLIACEDCEFYVSGRLGCGTQPFNPPSSIC